MGKKNSVRTLSRSRSKSKSKSRSRSKSKSRSKSRSRSFNKRTKGMYKVGASGTAAATGYAEDAAASAAAEEQRQKQIMAGRALYREQMENTKQWRQETEDDYARAQHPERNDGYYKDRMNAKENRKMGVAKRLQEAIFQPWKI
jgi:hypothetical protein